MQCGATLTVTPGEIFSPGYYTSRKYVDNENCDWFIVPPNHNSSVLIRFKSFATEFPHDYLKIYSDPPSYSTSVAKFSGTQSPYDRLFDGPIRLQFLSDNSTFYRGFSLSYFIVQGVAPRFIALQNNSNVTKGDDIVLSCRVTGVPKPVVTWYKDGLEVQFVLQSKFTFQGNDLIIRDIVEEDFGVFKCRAENHLNYTEQSFELSVNVPPVIVTHPSSIYFPSITEGSPGGSYFTLTYGNYRIRSKNRLLATFRCDVSGFPRPHIYWKKDGVILSEATTAFDWLIITNVSVSDQGRYSCFATNEYGSAKSRTASLTIGTVLPCCFSMGLQGPFVQSVATSSGTDIDLTYDGYSLSKVFLTKDGHHYQFTPRLYYRHASVHVKYSANDTGVYGYHLTLLRKSKSTLPKNITVSFYLPVLVQVPPHITVRPSSLISRTSSGHLLIFCSVYSYKSDVSISWYKNNGPVPSLKIKGTRFTTSYLRVNHTPDTFSDYTCKSENVLGKQRRSVVSVVLRVEEGGWSWWTESLPCGATCGSTMGFRIRSRRCYNESIRCPGYSLETRSCYPSHCLIGTLIRILNS
jgi:hypothetical protein